ncbi:MAG TPA: gluconate 2-dehydrogenase subunit 3 family protein [Bryobacteraceae bacterium]|nr:gluconate 2-dehydrogenase subunit 3 family protein [Bryobacteraceae bacterium]
MTRRDLIVLGSAAATAHAAPEFVFFTPAQATLVKLIAEQIIPADEDPGATDAGVVYYIDGQLIGPLAPFAPLYRDALPDFEPMRTMSFSAQTEFLKSIEKRSDAAARLFAVMVDHTMQGFYGSPADGGNRNQVSWKMLGIEREMGGHH